MLLIHCVKSVQIWSYFWSGFSCIRIEITPYLDTFHAVKVTTSDLNFSPNSYTTTSLFKNFRNIFFSIVASKYINYLIFTLFRSSKTGMRRFQQQKKKKKKKIRPSVSHTISFTISELKNEFIFSPSWK